MNRVAGNGLTLKELEEIEEEAYRSQTLEARTVLRLAAALREALQIKVNGCAFCSQSENNFDPDQPEERLTWTDPPKHRAGRGPVGES